MMDARLTVSLSHLPLQKDRHRLHSSHPQYVARPLLITCSHLGPWFWGVGQREQSPRTLRPGEGVQGEASKGEARSRQLPLQGGCAHCLSPVGPPDHPSAQSGSLPSEPLMSFPKVPSPHILSRASPAGLHDSCSGGTGGLATLSLGPEQAGDRCCPSGTLPAPEQLS